MSDCKILLGAPHQEYLSLGINEPKAAANRSRSYWAFAVPGTLLLIGVVLLACDSSSNVSLRAVSVTGTSIRPSTQTRPRSVQARAHSLPLKSGLQGAQVKLADAQETRYTVSVNPESVRTSAEVENLVNHFATEPTTAATTTAASLFGGLLVAAGVVGAVGLSLFGASQRRWALFAVNEVKTVSETVQEFLSTYTKPISPAYKTVILEILQTTHLTVVTKAFSYDSCFAAGLFTTFNAFMADYASDEREAIFSALTKALGLDAGKVKDDATKFLEAAQGKDEAALLEYVKSVQPKVQEPGFWYSRMFGVGIFTILEMNGVATSEENLTRWAKELNCSSISMVSDSTLYKAALEKLAAMTELIKQIEEREKTKSAERAAAKAAKAAGTEKEAEKEEA